LRVYTVHQPADPPADRIDRAEALRFVRDGFTWTAALFAPLWMIARGLWLALIVYLVGVAALGALAFAIGLSDEIRAVLFLALHALIGFEADQMLFIREVLLQFKHFVIHCSDGVLEAAAEL
jgi:hypothetical protein